MIVHSPQELSIMAVDWRKRLKLTQAEVAQRVGLQQKTISAFENKPESVMLATALLILSALNLEVMVTAKNSSGTNTKQWDQEW